MNNKIIDLLADRRIINENIIRLVNEDIKSIPYKKDDKCINIKTKEVFWIHDIRPTLLNGITPNGHFTIYVNPPKKRWHTISKEAHTALRISRHKEIGGLIMITTKIKECEMKHNPFVPREQRTAIFTFDNGQRVRAEITLPGTDKPVWHTELERRIVNAFNKAQPRAVHKLVKVHLLRTQSSQPFILRNIQL